MPNIIGTAPNQVPTNADLGSLAFQNKEAVNVDLIKLNTAGATAGTNQTVGTISWDDGNGTANITLKGGNVNLQVGQELVARVYNDSGVSLTDGQIVYISGAQGNRIAVKLANAASEATSAGTLGMVTEPIASGAEGFITIMGTVNGLNTSALTAGDLVYLSASTAGAYTTTAPTAPNHRVILGYVERVHATVGSIYVKVDNGYELDELHNVIINTPVAGQLFTYNGTTWGNSNAIVANTSTDALRITQTGSGNALLVEDSANPDSTPFVISQYGRVGVNGPADSAPVVGLASGLAVHSTATQGNVLSDYQWSNDGTQAFITLSKSRGATAGTQAIVTSGDTIGTLLYTGSDGTGFVQAARIEAAVDGTPGTNDMPGRLVFSTTADGASSPTERMRITNSGQVGVGGTPVAGTTLYVAKALTGSASSIGINNIATVQSDVTTSAASYSSFPSVQNASFTLPYLYGYFSGQGTIGVSATVTSQYGFYTGSTLTGATNNYGFYSNIASGTGRWNFYAAGSAANYFGGVTTMGKALQETKTAIGASDIDLSTGNYFTKTISGATTFTVSNVPASGTVGAFILELTNGGSATVTWFSGIKWASGTAPTLTATGVDIIAFYTHDGGTTWRGAVVAKDSK